MQAAPGALAKQVLAEVPDQVCRYFQLNNIAPGIRAGTAPATATSVPPSQVQAAAYPQILQVHH